MAKLYICKCGETFRKRRHLIEHVALQNLRWPRSSPEDQHSDRDANHPSLSHK